MKIAIIPALGTQLSELEVFDFPFKSRACDARGTLALVAEKLTNYIRIVHIYLQTMNNTLVTFERTDERNDRRGMGSSVA